MWPHNEPTLALPTATLFSLSVSSVLAVSVVIGLFDLVCEVITKDVAELKATVDQILATPGVSPRATMVCIVVGTRGARSEDMKKKVS
jgi:hypothetical protein